MCRSDGHTVRHLEGQEHALLPVRLLLLCECRCPCIHFLRTRQRDAVSCSFCDIEWSVSMECFGVQQRPAVSLAGPHDFAFHPRVSHVAHLRAPALPVKCWGLNSCRSEEKQSPRFQVIRKLQLGICQRANGSHLFAKLCTCSCIIPLVW